MNSFPSLKPLIESGEVVEVRGDGQSGGGLLMAMQSFAAALGRDPRVNVQEWPLFGSSRKGIAVRGFLRFARREIHSAAAIVRPHVSILLSESVTQQVDFASGMKDGIYIVNTPHSAWATAEKYRLFGSTITVDGDRIGEKYLGKRIGNISIFAALVRISGLLSEEDGYSALDDMMAKRRLPDAIRQANLKAYTESLEKLDATTMRYDLSWTREPKPFQGFPSMPIGAQSSLRTSLTNHTARYRPAGRNLAFHDPMDKCSGCALCITNCPENIIYFVPDERRGLKVTGANVVDFCKLCEECVQVCPVKLFSVEQETSL